ncbi:lytic polysaccharide monooxygenase [Streptomyces sp. NPDC001941]|uniref:lytic polysaccharide monooxygenase auxiliary activity family 9 protein n=1 Tax=Streptomyces sp. NPDC001941 TaxID=3154659 RepID=UPI003327D353
MRRGRNAAAVAVAGTVLVLSTSALTGSAQAHGAPWNPISRAAACAPDNERYSDSPACVAAQNASPAGALDAWDNLRLKDVNGRHRSAVPDGQLCSAGLPAYRGLDLPREDWPATVLHEGSSYDFAFLATVPHKGRLLLYITKDGYDPTTPLRWSDLESKPFLEVDDPPLVDSAYEFSGRLPEGKTGRHVIYTVWENSGLPDTYYYCSDVLFRGSRGADASPSSSTRPSPRPTPSGASPAPVEVAHAHGGTSPSTEPPLPTPSATPLTQAAPVAAESVPMTMGGRLAMTLSVVLAAVASVIVLVLTYFIRRQNRTRSS